MRFERSSKGFEDECSVSDVEPEKMSLVNGRYMASGRCVVVSNEDAVKRLWYSGAYGSSTRQTRFKPAFLEKKKLKRANPFEVEARILSSDPTKRIDPVEHDDDDDDENGVPPPEALRLNLAEAYYLVSVKSNLNVYADGGLLDTETLLEKCRAARSGKLVSFDAFFAAYAHFRDAGWIVKSGTQYGHDLVLYARDPDRCHSQYCVTLLNDRASFSTASTLRLMRVAEQTKKRAILCTVGTDGVVDCVVLRRWSLKHDGGVPRTQADVDKIKKKMNAKTRRKFEKRLAARENESKV